MARTAKKPKADDTPVKKPRKFQMMLGDGDNGWTPKIPIKVREAADDLRNAETSNKRAGKKVKETKAVLDDVMGDAGVAIVEYAPGQFYERAAGTKIQKVTTKKLRERNQLPPQEESEAADVE